jgi:pantoate--beta-alanine ligase
MASTQVIRELKPLSTFCAEARRAGRTIGLVPTMGALHEGHFSLVRASKAACDHTVVTIFVNPAQFAPHEDLDRYPRTFAVDLAQLEKLGTDVVFAPIPADIYPPGFSTYVEPPAVSRLWEGTFRPQFFRGVTTIVLKLFHLIPADISFFGQKDYQQLRVIQQMAADLNLPIEVRRCPIIREPDGLAMSSRNRYLDATQRAQAVSLSQGLQEAVILYDQGERSADQVTSPIFKALQMAGIDRIDYIAVADVWTLEPVTTIQEAAVILIAAYVGETRLIDNCLLGKVTGI